MPSNVSELALLPPLANCCDWVTAVLSDPASLPLLLPVKALLLIAEVPVLSCTALRALLAGMATAGLPVPCAVLFPAGAAAVSGGCAKLHGKQKHHVSNHYLEDRFVSPWRRHVTGSRVVRRHAPESCPAQQGKQAQHHLAPFHDHRPSGCGRS
jgi:hypothetical protein